MSDKLKALWSWLSGKKTYLIAIAGIAWGMYTNDSELILTALGLAGLRNGVTAEIAQIITKRKAK